MLRDKVVMVTGGDGFLGRHLTSLLNELGATTYTPCRDRSHEGMVDLTVAEDVDVMFANCREWGTPVDYCFHLAGYNGGIQFNLDNPAQIFFQNTVMGLNVIDACWRHGVKKVVSVVASCAYPEMKFSGNHLQGWMHHNREIMEERGFLDGKPHDSVACHGYAKRNLQLAGSFYRSQHGLRAVCACPTTLYGPGDSYDPARTKVMGAMVKRFVDAVDAGEREVVCWGNGKPYREFLYVEDAAKLLVEVMANYEDSDRPLNLGSGQERSIRQVAETVAAAVEFGGEIRFDDGKPSGQFRKRLDVSKMLEVIPYFPFTPLPVGVTKTVEDYRRRKAGEKVAA